MSGDVQPRKRKDKKKRKDDALPVEEPYRGTTASFGEGDVFLHTHHEHGTGGHWCAKVVFFSLLAVLITLIGLIILENRGLSDLEASSVQSQYSGVLEGWIEDAPDDDHHDEHTLDLKHHDEDEEDHHLELEDDDHEVDEDDEDHDNGDDEHEGESEENDAEDDDEQSNEDLDQEDQTQEDLDNEDQDDESDNYNENETEEQDDDENEQKDYSKQQESAENYEQKDSAENDDDEEENLSQLDNEDQSEQSLEDKDDAENEESQENQDDEDEHDDDDDHDEDDDDEETEIEHIEEESTDVEPISVELPALPEPDDDDDDDNKAEEETSLEDQSADDDGDDDEFLEHDDLEEDAPVVERITAPLGKPFQEVEEEDSTEAPPVDTLADEEEYERRQEELRREEEMASHMWLKLGVGAALLLATHAVVRRAVAPRDEPETENGEDETVREETPAPDRRMTLLPEQVAPSAPKPVIKEPPIMKRDEETVTRIPLVIKSAPTPKELSLDEEELTEPEEEDIEEVEDAPKPADEKNKELYSDDEEEIEEEVEEEEEEEEIIIPKKEAPKLTAPLQKPATAAPKPPTPEPSPEPDEDVPDDVEIIEEEELEEDEDEEEISDVDDVELLSRLEAKYGRLPEPERPGQKHKDGGDSLDDEWPGEPADSFWRERLDSAEREMRQGSWTAAVEKASATQLSSSARARWIIAKAYDGMAEQKRDNKLLSRSITAYLELLKMNEKLSNEKLLEITNRTLDRIQFRGIYLNAEPVHRLLIRRFPNNPGYRNNLTISFLMANRNDLAAESLKDTLKLWPNDRVALAHYGFIMKTHYNKIEEAVTLFQKALEGDTGPANEPRFYYHLGDSLLLLGRYSEAHEVHKRGAKLGHFLSPAQRSLYNVERLKSRPWWNIDQTPYARMARALEKSWKEILKEGEEARALYVQEKEGLREKGEWSQLDLFLRGREVPDRCIRAPVTCSIVKSEAAAVACRRGQIKFSSMEPGTHVRPHVGPTNCRLRMHLALSNTKDTYLRVDKETRQWQVGKVLMFDDSFEHEVWHNGTGSRLVLIVDVWHPDLIAQERRTLPSI